MSDKTIVTMILVWSAIIVLTIVWWVPQKWAACGKLYDNRVAQVICVGNG